jgi:general stress protein CsbA
MNGHYNNFSLIFMISTVYWCFLHTYGSKYTLSQFVIIIGIFSIASGFVLNEPIDGSEHTQSEKKHGKKSAHGFIHTFQIVGVQNEDA